MSKPGFLTRIHSAGFALKATSLAVALLCFSQNVLAQPPEVNNDLPEPILPTPAFASQTHAPLPPIASSYLTRTVATGLVHPWSLAFLPGGGYLVTERPGRIRVISRAGKLSAPLSGLPYKPSTPGFTVLDVALSPDFAQSRRIFITLTTPRGAGEVLALARADLNRSLSGIEQFSILKETTPGNPTLVGSDGRLVFDGAGRLFMTSAAPSRGFGQKLDATLGVTLRMNADGSVPADNPFTGRSDALPEIYSYGHRDSQGAAFHPQTRQLWEVEHGPRGGDEINIIRPGANYGWPVITYGYNYDKTTIGPTSKVGMEQPLYYWYPSIAPSGMMFYTGTLFANWTGNLFVGALKGRHLVRLVLDGAKVVAEEPLLGDLGQRIRDVRQGPDGAIYVLTDEEEGLLIQITPRPPVD